MNIFEERDKQRDAAIQKLRHVAMDLPEDFRFEIEENGHTFNFYSEWSQFDPAFKFMFALDRGEIFSVHEAEGLMRAWQENKPITELTFEIEANDHTSTHQHHRVPFSVSRFGGGDSPACIYCGQRDFFTDGFKIWPDRKCPYPNGIPVQVELEVPSGKLLVGNDFRDEFPMEDDFNVNEAYGIQQTVEAAAEAKMLHFYVGNTCPSLYRAWHDPNHLICANPVWDDDESDNDSEVLPIPGFQPESVASVCTDLWWVSIVDYDEAIRRGLSEDGPGWTSNDVIEVEPGTYVLDYHGLLKGFDREANGDDFEYDRETQEITTIPNPDKQAVIWADIRRKR